MTTATMNIKRWLTLGMTTWLLAATTSLTLAQETESARLTENTVLNFTSVKAGQKFIGERDDYIQRLGRLEIQLRLRSEKPITTRDYLKGLENSVIEWKKEEVELLKEATAKLRERMKNYRLPFPKQIQLIRVSSQGGITAPHCRQASIIMPDAFFENAAEVPTILAHELFHVLSNQNPKLRDRLYRIIHFERTNEVSLPAALKPRRLTNPDAPNNEHVVQLTIEEKKVPVVPVLIAKSADYKPGGLFANLDFKLMVLEKKDGVYSAKLEDGRPRLLTPREAPDYLQQIGRNTGYIIHPEEALADNFWMMLLGSEQIRDPWVIEGMKEVLKK